MPELKAVIQLSRCPHCNVSDPMLHAGPSTETTDGNGQSKRQWRFYTCRRCGGIITAWAFHDLQTIKGMFPSPETVDDAIPSRANSYLEQAIASLHAPAGSLMLSASAVDAMLKQRGYKDGSLNDRIKKAADDHVLTAEMAQWAHDIRLDANDQRHADEDAPLPTEADARHSIAFAQALGQILFVLPAQVRRGIADAQSKKK